jgi:hypothetical protein
MRAATMFRRVFQLAALAGLLAPAGAALGEPLRLAIIAEDPPLNEVSDLLTAEWSSQPQLALLERGQIEKILREQALAAGNQDYVKLGQLLGADGLLVLRVSVDSEPQVLSARLVAVKPGISVAQHDYPWPLEEVKELAAAMGNQFLPMIPKLAVTAGEAVPISILNLRSAVASPEAETLERQLTPLLYDRLTQEKEVFVMERRRLELLAEEKARVGGSESGFWNGSYLLDGVIDKQGFNHDTVNIEVSLTPPDKSKTTTVEVSGARTNLAGVVNELGTKILGAIKKPGAAASAAWDAPAEAERYFDEAKWMFHWQMYEEAKAGAEAAWGLGKQTREVAALRVQACLESAGSPGICVIRGRRVAFGRPFNPRITDAAELAAYASAPEPARFVDLARAVELYREALSLFTAETAAKDSTWISLATNLLDRSSWWLRYYYFNVEPRVGQEDKIALVRQLCREVAAALDQAGDAGQTNLLEIQARHVAFWTESPEQTLETYRRLLDTGKWPRVRARFLNASDKEVSLLISRGEAVVEATLTSPNADLASPCLAGWTWPERRRCPGVWKSFIDESCHSAKPLISLEGQILRCSYSWSEADFESNLTALLAYARSQLEAIDSAGESDGLLKDLDFLVGNRLGALSEERRVRVGKAWADFQRSLKQLVEARESMERRFGTPQQQLARLEQEENYLKTQTNFDFQSFTKVMIHPEYRAEEAKALLPLVADFKARISSNNVPGPGANRQAAMMSLAQQHTTGFWTGELRKKLEQAVSNQVSVANPAPVPAGPAATNTSPPPINQALNRGFPPNQAGPGGGAFGELLARGQAQAQMARGGFAGGAPAFGAMPAADLSGIPAASNTLHVHRYWSAPALTNAEVRAPPFASLTDLTKTPRIGSCCYRDGKLWLELRYDALGGKGLARFAAVDLNTFSCQSIEFRNEEFSLPNLVVRRAGSRPFEVDANYLYVTLGDFVRRYSFKDKVWEPLKEAGSGKPVRLGRRLFFVNSTSILESTEDGTFRVLASTRRRPAVSALDQLDNYDPGFLFLDTRDRLLAWIGSGVYALDPGAKDWERIGAMPGPTSSRSWWFDEGFMAQGNDGWWGVSSHSPKPELLFRLALSRTTPQPNPVAPRMSAPLWDQRPPSPECCLDGNCLWSLVPRMDGEPQAPARPGGPPAAVRPLEATLVRFKFGEATPVAVPVRFEAAAVDGPRSFNQGLRLPSESQWLLEPAPEGLVAAPRSAPGFWLISRKELAAALATVNQGQSGEAKQ